MAQSETQEVLPVIWWPHIPFSNSQRIAKRFVGYASNLSRALFSARQAGSLPHVAIKIREEPRRKKDSMNDQQQVESDITPVEGEQVLYEAHPSMFRNHPVYFLSLIHI